MPGQRLLKVAAIVGAHGLRGQVTIKTFTESATDVAAYGPLSNEFGTKQYTLRLAGQTRGLLIASINGVESREAAEALKGVSLYLDANLLPPPDENEVYYHELEGMMVVDEAGATLGTVQAAVNYGAGDILEIKYISGESEMFPFTDAIFPHMDKARRTITFIAPESVSERD